MTDKIRAHVGLSLLKDWKSLLKDWTLRLRTPEERMRRCLKMAPTPLAAYSYKQDYTL